MINVTDNEWTAFPWLGQPPSHWRIRPLKHELKFKVGWTPPTGNSTFFEGENPWATIGDLNSEVITETQSRISDEAIINNGIQVSPVGSLLYSFKLSVGKVAFAGVDLYTNEAIASFHPSPKVDLRFFYYTLPDYLWRYSEENIYGAKLLNQERIKNARLAIPPSDEQRHIAAYLDEQTAKIDRLINLRQRQITLLKEQRAALIQQAVTRGLNPNVPMKDSGLPWLGEIPADWDVMPIKRVLYAIIDTEHKTAPAVSEGKYLVARTTNIKDGRLVFDGAYYTDENSYLEWTRRGVPIAGDILFTREAPAGEACVVPKDIKLCIGQRVVLFRVNQKRIVADFLLNSLYSGVASNFVRAMSQGSTVPHLNMGDIPMIPIILPSLDEQHEVADFIFLESEKIDKIIFAYSRQLTLLTEYRAALIHECVTGKRAVPDDFNPGDYTND